MVKYKIPCGWTVYDTFLDEVRLIGGMCICDDCGGFFLSGHLVPVLNHYMCNTCFRDWRSRTKFYPSDVDFEARNMAYYESKIPLHVVLDSDFHMSEFFSS